jgi:hypothetical protein
MKLVPKHDMARIRMVRDCQAPRFLLFAKSGEKRGADSSPLVDDEQRRDR